MEFKLFLQMLVKLRTFLQLRSMRLEKEKAHVDATLNAVNHAANHTRAYLADVRKNDDAKNRDLERSLSDKWLEVGNALRKIDVPEARELHERCFMKARYWSDPDGWNDAIANELDISLENVLSDVQTAVDD